MVCFFAGSRGCAATLCENLLKLGHGHLLGGMARRPTSATKIPTSTSHRIKDDLSAPQERYLMSDQVNQGEGPQAPLPM